MKRVRVFFVIAGTMLISAAAVAQASGRVHQGDHWAFVAPVSWIDLAPGTSALVAVASPVAANGFAPNVNLVREPFSGNPQAYAATNVQQLSGVGRVLGQRNAMMGAVPAFDIETRWPGATPHRTVQRMTVAGGYGYVLTCSGADAPAVHAICDPILASFQLTP